MRLSPAEKRELERLADAARVTVAHALRAGALAYLEELERLVE